MVQLRLTVNIPPRSYDGDQNDDQNEGVKFLLVVPDPDKVNVGMLANMIHAQWQKLRPGFQALGIKKLLDDNYDAYELDMDLYLSEVFVDSGKAKADGYDQRGAVRVVQKPAYYHQVGYGSISKDFNATVGPPISAETRAAITGGPVSAASDMEHNDTNIEHPENADEEVFNNGALTKGTSMEESDTVRYPSDISDGHETPDEDVFQPAGDTFDTPQKSASVGSNEKSVRFADEYYFDTAETAGLDDLQKETETKDQGKDGARVKPFRETEAEFRRTRATTVGPDLEQFVESPFKRLLDRERKRKQSEPPQSATETLRTDRDENSPSNSATRHPMKTSIQVQIPVPMKTEEVTSDGDGGSVEIPVTPRRRGKRQELIRAEHNGDTYEVPSSPSSPLATSPSNRALRRSAESQKSKELSSKECSFSSPRKPSQGKEDSTLKAREKSVPPPPAARPATSYSSPIGKIISNLNQERALEAARENGADEAHLNQIKAVESLNTRYREAVEDGRSERRLAKLRARLDRAKNTLKEQEAETAKKKEENRRQEEVKNILASTRSSKMSTSVSSAPHRASNGQSTKGSGKATPTTPRSNLGATNQSTSKPSRSTSSQRISSITKKQERPKMSETTKKSVKRPASERTTKAPAPAHGRTIDISSSENEGDRGAESSEVDIVDTRPRKRLRRGQK